MTRSWTVSAMALVVAVAPAAARSPNIVIFYADDMGIGDVGCYGCNDIKTPQIDALAESGIRLTNYYSAAPLCAPSRAALMSGRYPNRAGMSTSRNVGSGMNEPGMPGSEVTIAELAKTRGYATGVFGKWHLGSTPDTQPNAQGFDLFFGHHASCVDPYSHWYYASEPYYHDLYRNREEVYEDGQHVTDLITRETLRFIESHHDEPFLVYVSYNTPHYPVAARGRFIRQYAHLPRLRRDCAALVAGIDESVGLIMQRVEELKPSGDTLVFFSSDNGAPNRSPRGEGGGSNAPFREFKRSLFDGGIRMPGLVSWPGTVPGGQTRGQLAIAMDVFATVAEVIGAPLPGDRVIDGHSWMPFLKDAAAPGQETLFFEWDAQQAVRQGPWKVVRNGLIDIETKGRQNRATGDDFVFLSNIEADPGESRNLAKEHPEVAERLLKLHEAWLAGIGPAK